MNLTLRTVGTILVALAFWLSGAGIAAAHTALADSDPAKDANLTVPPSAIVLTFTEDINPAFANIVVSSADGRNWVSGSPQVQGPRLTAAVRPDRPPPGNFTVGYRVVSADGHPVSGTYTFTITAAPGEPSPVSTPTGAAPSTAAATPPSSAPAGSDTKTAILTAAVAGLAVGGAIAFWQSTKRRRRSATEDETHRADTASADDETDAG